MAATLEQRTVLPPTDPKDTALNHQLVSLLDAIDQSGEQAGVAYLVGPDGARVELSEDVYALLRDVVHAIDQGRGVTIVPRDTKLTTQQAADMLNISRPTLVKLLEQGEIPYTSPGRHRRLLLKDVLAYQERARRQRREMLDELTRTASEDGTADSSEEFIQTR